MNSALTAVQLSYTIVLWDCSSVSVRRRVNPESEGDAI